MIDFTYNYWGHAIHPSTWREVPFTGFWEKRKAKKNKIARYSIMCHTSADVSPGKQFKFLGFKGEVVATITKVKIMSNVDDMYELTYTVDEKGRPT